MNAMQLSLWQPWATLVARGAKRIETRSWSTPYRGPILIHAAVAWNRGHSELAASDLFSKALGIEGLWCPEGNRLPRYGLPFGAIVAVAELVDCRSTGRMIGQSSELFSLASSAKWVQELDARERAFGDFAPGRYGWSLADVRPLAEPLHFRGFQGLRSADPAIVAEAVKRAGVAA